MSQPDEHGFTPNQLAFMQAVSCRGDSGLTDRCCERIKAFAQEHFKHLPLRKRLEIAGAIGAIVREESWDLVANAWLIFQAQRREENQREN